MSRPCFALSVMLCFMAGPLLIIGKTHARDTVVSPIHDPGECIVCPLVHGPLEVCGGYSDYDCNEYWYDNDSPPTPEATAQAESGLKVVPALPDSSTEEAWESGYEDYYADYVFGDDSTTTDAEDSTLEETTNPAPVIDAVGETAPTLDVLQGEEISDLYDEYGCYNEDIAATYDPTDPAKPDAASADEATLQEAAVGDQAYEEEWFSYGSETTVEAPETIDLEADEAYEALSESTSEASSGEIIDADLLSDTCWGDEEAWYREEYGYQGEFDEAQTETAPYIDIEPADVEPAEQLDTGYDEAYDQAMATDLEAAEPVADNLPANPGVQLPEPESQLREADDYESYCDAYDDLYNFESTPAEASHFESGEATAELAADADAQQAMDVEPAWLTALVNRILAPIRAAATGIASNASILDLGSRPEIDLDECARGWNCESDYWAEPRIEQPSVVLSAADTLDGMATVLQNAAEFLRSVAGGRLLETAQAKGGPTR